MRVKPNLIKKVSFKCYPKTAKSQIRPTYFNNITIKNKYKQKKMKFSIIDDCWCNRDFFTHFKHEII